MTEHNVGMRRVVTYRDDQGVSRFLENEIAPRVTDYKAISGMRSSILWGLPGVPTTGGRPDDGALSLESVHPSAGGSVFLTLTLPPDSVYASADFDPYAASAEQAAAVPGVAERMEPDGSGFHRTDTLDYVIVVHGEVWLVLDHEEKRLGPGDSVIQIGARHAWQNRTDVPATLAVVMVGSSR